MGDIPRTSLPRRREPDRLGNWAVCLGATPLALAGVVVLGTQAGTEGWSKFSVAAIILTPALSATPGLVLGILALVRPAHGPEIRRRRVMASIGIGLAVLGFIAIFFAMLAVNSFIT